MKERIWELDALRGLGIILMIYIHLLYDLGELLHLIQLDGMFFYQFCIRWGGVLFLIISGVCINLSKHYIKRGLWVLGAGFVCSLVTFGTALVKLADPSIIIYFGVLHCLGVCMILWHFFRKMSPAATAVTAAVLIAVGLWILPRLNTGEFPWLIALGLYPSGFASSDYFPLLPNLGYFLAGALAGRLLYREKRTLFPNANLHNPIIRFLNFCGRHSLPIYLLHQPVLAAVLIGLLFLIY